MCGIYNLISLLICLLFELLLFEKPLFEFLLERVSARFHANIIRHRVPYPGASARVVLHVAMCLPALRREEAVFSVTAASVVIVNLLSPYILLIMHRSVWFVCVDMCVHFYACA